MASSEARIQSSETYRPNKEVLAQLKNQSLITIVGPAGVGKSTLLDAISQQDTDFGRTGTIVTRAPEARDDPRYIRYITLQDARHHIAHRDFVGYIVHPTTGNVYAMSPDMYTHTYNMIEALPASISLYHSLNHKAFYVFYLVTEASAWQKWFNERYAQKSDERNKRLQEATLNLTWALHEAPKDMAFIYNTPSAPEEAALQIINQIKYNQKPTPENREYAVAMLERIKEME